MVGGMSAKCVGCAYALSAVAAPAFVCIPGSGGEGGSSDVVHAERRMSVREMRRMYRKGDCLFMNEKSGIWLNNFWSYCMDLENQLTVCSNPSCSVVCGA